MSWLRRTSAFSIFAALLLAALLLVSPRVALAEFEDGPAVTITNMVPAILTNEDTVTFNINLASLPEGVGTRVSIYMTADSLATPEAIDAFIQRGGTVWSVGELTLSDEEYQQAQTASGVDLVMEYPTDSLPIWNPDDWGPVGVEVRVGQGEVGDRSLVDSCRGLMLWYPEEAEGSARLNALVSDAWKLPKEDWTALSREGVTLALQPEQARSLTTSSSEEVLVLPSRAADISLLAATEQASLLDLALRSRDAVQAPSGAKWVQNAILTSDRWISTAALGAANGDTVLSPPGGISDTDGDSVGGKFSVDAQSGAAAPAGSDGQQILVSYSLLAAVFSDPALDSRPAFERDQLLRAHTAVGAKAVLDENYEGPARLWVNLSVGTDSATEAIPAGQVVARLGTILDVPWIRPSSLGETLRANDFGDSSGAVPTIPNGDVAAAASALFPVNEQAAKALALSGSAGAPPSEIITVAQHALPPATMGLTEAQIASQAQSTETAIKDRYDVISIVPSQSVNITGPRASFPVTVTNAGDAAVDVEVGIVPSSHLIQVDEWVPITIAPNSTESASVPVRAVGSGNVNVVIEAKSPDGTVLAAAPEILVRSHPALGDAITWVAGSLLGALFLVGLVRTIRKGRRRPLKPSQ